MPVWYGLEDTWPRHTESWWREALLLAQQGGWWLEHNDGGSAHRFGKLRCSRNDDRSATCTIKVDGSGKGAENVARDVPKKIRNCPHRADDPATPQARMARAAERLDDARRLLDAAERVLSQQGRLSEAHAMLLLAFDEAAQDVERLVEQASAAEAAAAEGLQAAREALAEVASGATDPAAGAAAADRELDRAEEELSEVPGKVKDARSLRSELVRLRGRAQQARDAAVQARPGQPGSSRERCEPNNS